MCVSIVLEPTCEMLIPKSVVMNYDRGVRIFEIDIDVLIPHLPVNAAIVIIATAIAEMVNPISISFIMNTKIPSLKTNCLI